QADAVDLTTVDDSLATGRESDTATGRVPRMGKLHTRLDTAHRAHRPVILVSDHGHVWDRAEKRKTSDGEAARYRTGTPHDGEILVNVDRVLAGGVSIVVPWDERIRSTSRLAGYHGGISTADIVIPVLVFLLGKGPLHDRWETLRPTQHEPALSNQSIATRLPDDTTPPPRRATRAPAVDDDNALISRAEVVRSLGQRIVDTAVFADVHQQIPKSP